MLNLPGTFLPRDAMHARYMLWPCVRLSDSLSQVGVLLKRGHQMQVGWVKIGDFRQIAGYI